MKIYDVRLDNTTTDSYGNGISAEVEIEMDEGKVHVFHFALNPYEIQDIDMKIGTPAQVFSPGNNMAHTQAQYNNQKRDPLSYTVDDYMPQIRREVARLIANRIFSEWDKMQKLKS